MTNQNINSEEKTFDVVFNDEIASDCKGFHESYEYCKRYIDQYNGTAESYFGDYKGGTVSIVCNETGEEVYSEEIGKTRKSRKIRSNAKQLYRELYDECDWKDTLTFREYVENDMENAPDSWNWLFNVSDDNLSYSDLTDKEKEDYNDFLDSLEDDDEE